MVYWNHSFEEQVFLLCVDESVYSFFCRPYVGCIQLDGNLTFLLDGDLNCADLRLASEDVAGGISMI